MDKAIELAPNQIAAGTGADSVSFRLRYLKAPRDIAVVKAAAEHAQWQPRARRRGPTAAATH